MQNLQAPGITAYTHHRLIRLVVAWLPRMMRLLGLHPPKQGLVLKVNPEGQIVQQLGDPQGQVVYGVASAIEADGKLFLGTLHRHGVPVLDLNKVTAS